eukprot:CAMPEP_0201629636 /NCGR_PEP_ID=MMETSP0493-20130528/4230_1 /ASSEMBLY_ACC=CAM_ASM_000838 /TAXON_ID=420259 /ORGANISM="Thalassiosira gravida, Strain GMp14c1" /LENGTH=68 /DNA_ID=CAMNT_0048100663 /DNA_START=44 /DNA_END=250 /DNA_ORIENTATION=+
MAAFSAGKLAPCEVLGPNIKQRQAVLNEGPVGIVARAMFQHTADGFIQLETTADGPMMWARIAIIVRT